MNENDNEANSVLVSSTEEKPYNTTTEPIENSLLQINWKQALPQVKFLIYLIFNPTITPNLV